MSFRWPTKNVSSCAALFALLTAIGSAVLTEFVNAAPTHYLVISENSNGGLSLYAHRIVDIDGIEQNAASSPRNPAREQSVSIEIVDKLTSVTSTRGFATAATSIRGEFHGSALENGIGHTIESFTAPAAERVYVIRIPVETNQVLRLKKLADSSTALSNLPGIDALGAGTLDIDLDQVPATLGTAALPTNYDVGTVVDSGPSSNRLDLLIMGDGYTLGEKTKFVSDATNLANTFLNIAPYSTFKHLINVHWLFVPSNQSGADKPPGSDCTGTVVLVDTAFDGKFCTSNIRRLVTVNSTKVNAAAVAVPDWDTIIVLVNDSEYGGAGGSISVVTTHPAAVQVAQHEFGHTFSRLADEYTTPYPGFPTCSDLGAIPSCEANVTDQTSRALIKWGAWISPTTPIPSISPVVGDPLAAGLWKGARYLGDAADTMYRQCNNGAMKSLGAPFCRVDSEAFVKRLYAIGSSGVRVPSTGIDFIEPRAIPGASTVSAVAGSTVTFRGRAAASLTPLTYEWRVNSVVAATGTTNHGQELSHPFVVPAGGATIELKIIDPTPFLLVPHTRSRVWTISSANHAINVEKAGSGNGTVSSAPTGLSCGSTCTLPLASPGTVTLTATANVGSKFMGWMGACVGTLTCVINVNGISTVRAVFAPTSTVASLDIDSNGQIDALTDGALVLRYLTQALTQPVPRNVLGPRSARTSTSSLAQFLENVSPALDIDGNGTFEQVSDGLLIVRYLLGFRSNSLIQNAIGVGATRTSVSSIEAHLQSLMVPN